MKGHPSISAGYQWLTTADVQDDKMILLYLTQGLARARLYRCLDIGQDL